MTFVTLERACVCAWLSPPLRSVGVCVWPLVAVAGGRFISCNTASQGFSFNTPYDAKARTWRRAPRRGWIGVRSAHRISAEDMPTWEAPRSAAEAAKAALKALRGGTQSQPRGIDALFKPPTTGPWSRDKQGAVLCALLIGVTVVLVSARRRRRTGDGLTVTINLQLSELPEELSLIHI